MNKKVTLLVTLVCPALLLAGLTAVMLTGCRNNPPETTPTGQTQGTPGGETTEESVYGLGDAILTPEDADTMPSSDPDSTDPAQTDSTTPSESKPTEGTKPEEGTTAPSTGADNTPEQEETTAPTQTDPEPTDPPAMTLEAYEALSAEEQEAYADSFTSKKAFNKWYLQALRDYEEGDVIEVTGPIDLGELGK